MPLIKSGSKDAFDTNVSEMVEAGHPKDQSLAAAYSVKRKAESGRSPLSRFAREAMRRAKKPPQRIRSE